jgi:hypothetical protein
LAFVGSGTEIKRGVLVLMLGMGLVCFACYQSRWVIGLFTDPGVYHIYIESIILPLLPACVGVYCIYIALRKGPILTLKEGRQTHRLRLRDMVRNGQVAAFEAYLTKRLGARLMLSGG